MFFNGKPLFAFADIKNGGSFASLHVKNNGTYYADYEAATVTWDESTEYDGTLDVDGITLRYKKVKSLTVPDDVSALNNPEYCFAVTLPDGTTQAVPLSNLGIGSADGAYMSAELMYAVVWIKDAASINAGYGASFEDNAVYITDFLWLYSAEYAGCKFSITAQGQELDGFSSVTVEVESAGGGLAINGEVKEVAAREAVNAGDFVELVNDGAAYSIAEAKDNAYMSVAMANPNKMVVAYGTTYKTLSLYAISFEDGAWKKGTTASQAITSDSVGSQRKPYVVMLTEDVGIVAYGCGGTGGSGKNIAYACAFRVNEDRSITFGTAKIIANSNSYNRCTYALCKLDSNRAVAYGEYTSKSSSTINTGFVVLTVDENLSVSSGEEAALGTGITSYCRISAIDEAHILSLHGSQSTGSCTAKVLTISGNTVTVGASLLINYAGYARGCAVLSESVFVAAGSAITAVLLWDGTTLSKAKEISVAATHVGAVSSTRFLLCTSSAAKLMDCESTIEEISTAALTTSTDGQLLAVTGNNFFYSYLPTVTPIYIEGDAVSEGVREQKSIQPCKGSFNVYGVAMNAANAGDTVQVCVPHFS